ncbi:MAG TPA: glycosyltransferase [Elusimicrobiota bacterium]|nr:glycosyltransferase [Elusimicrobiota bacterium]
MPLGRRRIALIHDWLTGMRGGEKVLELLCEIFPGADIFTLIHKPGQVSDTIERHRIHTSFLQAVPSIDRYYRPFLPVMPAAIERFNFQSYDVLISTSHCVAKAAIPPERARHWCYCHTPMRYIWDQFDAYFGPGRTTWAARLAMRTLRPRLQRWDVATASRVHQFIANSRNVEERIQRIYGRSSTVIYPPVDVDFYSAPPSAKPPSPEEPFFLMVGAFAPYKRLDLALECFRQLGLRLVMIGDGQESSKLRRYAGNRIEFLGCQSKEIIRDYYHRAESLVFPGEEDFGMVPVEAMAAGCPVIAYGKGGALETVVEGRSGVFFNEQSVRSLSEAVQRFGAQRWDRDAIQRQAASFSRRRTEEAFRSLFVEYREEMS